MTAYSEACPACQEPEAEVIPRVKTPFLFILVSIRKCRACGMRFVPACTWWLRACGVIFGLLAVLGISWSYGVPPLRSWTNGEFSVGTMVDFAFGVVFVVFFARVTCISARASKPQIIGPDSDEVTE